MKAKATALLGGQELVFGLNYGQSSRFDEEVFKRMVDLALEAGATHIKIDNIPFKHNSWVLPDNTDPYAAWCNHSAGFLRLCPPDELQEWIPTDEAKAARDALNQQLELIRPYKLKAVAYAVEPMWLPEGVYRAHPRWRGPQCELGRIACRPYFAPSVDEPEVLELYRKAAREYSRLFPEVDQFHFLMNDSGSGISWSPNIYPGMNGPAKYRLKDRGERISCWLKAVQEGSAESGVTMRLDACYAGMLPETCNSARRQAPENIYIRSVDRNGKSFYSGGASFSGGIWNSSYPVQGIGHPEDFIAGLQSIYTGRKKKDSRAIIQIGAEDIDLTRDIMRIFFEKPGQGSVNKLKTAMKVAEELCEDKGSVENMLSIWQTIKQATHCILQVRQKGFGLVIPFCGVSMRWLTRPLVPEPEKLTAEEKAHYRDYLFSPGDTKDEPSFSFVLGKMVFRGESVMWMARWCLHEAIGLLNSATARLNAIEKTMKDGDRKKGMKLFADRISAYSCLAANAKNCIMYQYALDVKHQPQYGPNQMDYDDNIIYDQRALNMRKVAREELDNMTTLIELLEAHPGESVLEHAVSPDEESVFMLGPNLLSDLKRKMDIMLDHWQDYERLYPATKVYDFEPEIKGNIVSSDQPSEGMIDE